MSKIPIHSIADLRAGYAAGRFTPRDVIAEVTRRAETGQAAAWIYRLDSAALGRRTSELEIIAQSDSPLPPLFGVPFAVKDNIDVAGLPTTAGCPAFAYTASSTAPVVQVLLDAGAILVGKTNMDQFATGLVGTRTPYGICHSVPHPDYVSGGSSSGSAVAVAEHTISFSLGTDTAGSGRVPAAFNGIIGLKPTRGLLSTLGVVPACLSLDCVSIFASDIEGAQTVLGTATSYVHEDPYSRSLSQRKHEIGRSQRIGVPRPEHLEFFGDEQSRKIYEATVQSAATRFEMIEFDYAPFAETARLLYGGAWVAERYAAVGEFVDAHVTQCDPTVASIIQKARTLTAPDAFKGMYALEQYKRITAQTWEQIDCMLLPTTGTIYSIDEVAQQPIALNSNLGMYTNFVNLLDLCALAIPAGARPNKTTFGVTLIAPAGCDEFLCSVAGMLPRAT